MVSMSAARPEKPNHPKRFYRCVAATPCEGGWSITLDGKTLRTQARHPLYVASQPLAEALADEWEAQTTHILPDTMPLTRLVNLTIDRMETDRPSLIEEICRYAETDLLCYRAPAAEAPVLRAAQDAAFTPVLAWALSHGMRFSVTDGLMPIPQPSEALARIRSMAESAAHGELAALAMMVPLLGSTLLAFALWHEALDAETALTAARLDEIAQAERWGSDPDAEALWADKCRDIRACAQYLCWVQQGV